MDFFRIGIETIETTVGGDRFGAYGAYTGRYERYMKRDLNFSFLYQKSKVALTSRNMYCTVHKDKGALAQSVPVGTDQQLLVWRGRENHQKSSVWFLGTHCLPSA